MSMLELPPASSLVATDAFASLDLKSSALDTIVERIFAPQIPNISLPYAYSLDVLNHGLVVHVDEQHVLFPTHNAGLFSCLCTMIWCVRELQLRGRPIPTVYNNSFGMHYFKSHHFANSYLNYFLEPAEYSLGQVSKLNALSSIAEFDHHGSYRELYLDILTADWIDAYLDCYMRPSAELSSRIDFFIEKYCLLSKKTIAVCYRGTDKILEVTPDPVERYVVEARNLFNLFGADQLLIQTDQAQVKDFFLAEFPDNCVFIKELPTTELDVVMHRQRHIVLDPESWTMDLIAMVFAVSRCQAIVCHTGNIGFFIAMLAMRLGREFVQLS